MPRHRVRWLIVPAALLLLSSAPVLRAQAVSFDGPVDTNNCYPFGCYSFGGRYQQAYNGVRFGTSPLQIGSISFFGDEILAGVLASTYTLRLSTTSRPLGALSTTFDDNLGVDAATVYRGMLSGVLVPGQAMNVAFSTPFVFDPAAGNLLLDVVASDATESGLYALDAAFSDEMARVFTLNGGTTGFTDPYGFGLRTQFGTVPVASLTSATTVPEPASLTLVATGLTAMAGASLALRRRRHPRWRGPVSAGDGTPHR